MDGLAANLITASASLTALIERRLCEWRNSEEILGRQCPYAMSRRPKVSFELVHVTELGRLLPLVSG